MCVHLDVPFCRRKNPEKPYNRYLVAVYKCQEGFQLQDPSVDRLYCTEDEWVGEEPACISASNGWLYFLQMSYARPALLSVPQILLQLFLHND
jgi:hypothetical protein